MKKITLLSLITIVFISNLIAQAPNLMSYQAVIWDASGNLVAEKMVSIKISILQGSVSGSSVYSETHRVQTNINGLVSLMIGGGTNATGKISDINWGEGSFFLKTETDPTGGVNFSITGTTQFVSVPYSLASNISDLAKNISTKNIGSPGQTLTIDKDGKMTWVSNLPTISTNVITDIKPNSSVSGGSISSDGGSPVTARGVVWSTNSNPTISLSTKTSDGSGIGNFTSNLIGLSSNTTYYVRAYATNSVGTSYGNEIIFTTVANLPILTTSSIQTIYNNGATSGGSITSDGGSPVTARGVIWSTSPNPNISLSTKSNDGTGLGSFISNLSGLNPSTTYYVKAYASNSTGTGYGNEVIFQTVTLVMNVPCTGTPTIKDIDGNIYNTVQIGSQCWMKENLKVAKYRDGSIIPLDTSGGFSGVGTGQKWTQLSDGKGARSVYNHNPSNQINFGSLYSWFVTKDPKGVCPVGWHVPGIGEWRQLQTKLGENEGGKMKTVGTSIWNAPNNEATNISGFSGLPSGLRNVDGLFDLLFQENRFWTSSDYVFPHSSWAVGLVSNGDYLGIGSSSNQAGLAIRCLRDSTIPESISQITTLPTNDLVAWYPFNGNAKDETGNGFNGEVIGAKLTEDRNGKLNSAYRFKDKEFIDIPNSQDNNLYPMTISLWGKIDSGSTGGSIFNKYVSASWNGYAIWSAGNINEGAIYPFYLNGGNIPNGLIGGYGISEDKFIVKSIEMNKWFHFVMVVDEKGGSLYFNGKFIDKVEWRTPPSSSNNNYTWHIGGRQGRTWPDDYPESVFFRGSIDDVAIWKRSLTESEILKIYKGEKF